jgi:carbon storage regulator CsrA
MDESAASMTRAAGILLKQGDGAVLVLTRKAGERILIGKDVWLVVEKINGNRVKLGIEAPKEVKILREEVKDERPDSD